MYKYILGSKRISYILTTFYNKIVKACYYPERWLLVLDIMIKKGKGPKLGKLRTIQLIEADMQLLIRVFMSLRNQGKIEKDVRLLKCNYSS